MECKVVKDFLKPSQDTYTNGRKVDRSVYRSALFSLKQMLIQDHRDTLHRAQLSTIQGDSVLTEFFPLILATAKKLATRRNKRSQVSKANFFEIILTYHMDLGC
jgi:hypothetical protein